MSKRLIIILGYTLETSGDIKPILQMRLDKAISIYKKSDTLLVCGKYPPKALVPDRCEQITEAQAMKLYLIKNGIPAENILKEEKSATTFGNAFFSYLDFLQDKSSYEEIIVVSNEFHGPLVRYCFDKVLGDKHPYIFEFVPDKYLNTLPEEVKNWKYIIEQLVEECYPLLFEEVTNGDINAIESVINSAKREAFKSRVRGLLHLSNADEVVIASDSDFF